MREKDTVKGAKMLFCKIVAVPLAVLAAAAFTGKAGYRTARMLGEERTGVFDFASVKELVRQAADILGVAPNRKT